MKKILLSALMMLSATSVFGGHYVRKHTRGLVEDKLRTEASLTAIGLSYGTTSLLKLSSTDADSLVDGETN